jgi:hypothetical protein
VPARASSRRGLFLIGLLLVVLGGVIEVLLRGDRSVIRQVWEGFVPEPTPIERALERLPR